MNWYLDALKKYAVFQGRARRKEYWYFTLFNLLVCIVLTGIDNMMGTLDFESGIGLLGGIYSLLVFLPALGVLIRRLHDIGKTGWWFFIMLVPIIGMIVILVFLLKDSQPEENEYGPNPKFLA